MKVTWEIRLSYQGDYYAHVHRHYDDGDTRHDGFSSKSFEKALAWLKAQEGVHL